MREEKVTSASGSVTQKLNGTKAELKTRSEIVELLHNSPIPKEELLENLALYQTRQNVSHILFIRELYKLALGIHGVIMEFGVRWGRNLALYESFRGIYEPFNHNRMVVGFDTFDGFPSVHEKDGSDDIIAEGSFNVTSDYKTHLEKLLELHEQEAPISHIKKHRLIVGDATKTVAEYLASHPETIISLAYFDFDIYEPTREVLEQIMPFLTKGSVIGFDQLNNQTYPGETLAFAEIIGRGKYSIRHTPYSPTKSFLVLE